MKKRPSPSPSPSPIIPCSSSTTSSSCISTMAQIRASKSKPRRSRTKTPTTTPTSPKSRRSSIYRGVTRHRWTGRFEAHLWDKSSWNSIQNKKGRQIYLGAYNDEVDAARTYDLAALKYWGSDTILNFPVETYAKDLEQMEEMTKDEYLAHLRRRSNGFSRGVSKYRGVARHHHNGRWEARIGRVSGNKYLYLGTFDTQEEAAEAYDIAALEHRGPTAVTNFDINRYTHLLKNLVQPSSHEQKEDIQPKLENDSSPPSSKTSIIHQEISTETHIAPESKSEVIDTINDSQVMDPTTEVPDHPWHDICLDVGFNNFPIPHIPMEQASDVFDDYKGFEDNIEFIFDGPVNDIVMLLQDDAMSGSGRCNVETMVVDSPNDRGPLSDALASPSSSTTSVCSNM